MKVNENDLKIAPDMMNKEQFTKLCHLSKRTALYLLESGLLPSTNTGKKTRCYIIKKSDVIEFINDKTNNPNRYIPPNKWYTYGKPQKSYTVRIYPDGVVTKDKMESYYKKCLARYPDLLITSDVVKFTGYARQTVMNWVEKDRLKILTKTSKYYIPKVFLIDFLCSDYYNGLIRKTKKHMDAIWQMSR